MSPDGSDSDSELSETSTVSIPEGLPGYLHPLSPASSLSTALSLSPPPSFREASFRLPSPPTSQDAGEEMPPARKRRKIEPRPRTAQYLDLISDDTQSEYDRQQSLDLLLRAIRKRRKIVVIAGAGISVSAGIPDFRSSQGLFRSLKTEHKLKSSGKELFDASVYKDDSSTSSFHEMVRQLSQLSKDAKPTLFHRLLARLSAEGRLLRLYTQNVDGLENRLPPLATTVPLPHKGPWPKTIPVHGGLEKMVCQKCGQISDFDEELFRGSVPPPCPECQTRDSIRTEHAGKRSHGIGRLRPRIVLYNEHNPDDEAIGAVTTADMRTRPDCVIVVGTSMKIPAIKRITHEMCKIVRDRKEGTTIWINHDPTPPGNLEDCWDLTVRGDADDVAQRANLKEWDDNTPDIVETYTDSDVEKSKIAHGIPTVHLPSPKKTLPAALMAPATPPLSPRPVKLFEAPPNFVLKIPISPSAKPATKPAMKNPASNYKPLNSIASITKPAKNPQKSAKTQNKRPSTKSGKPKAGLLSTFGKATKVVSHTTAIAVKKEPQPLTEADQSSPKTIKLKLDFKQGTISSESSPCPESPPDMMTATPPAQVAGPQSSMNSRPNSSSSNKDVITPPSVPRGMQDLFN